MCFSDTIELGESRMLGLRKILFTVIAACALTPMALADIIPSHPGWKLNRIQADENEVSQSFDYQQYFALEPPAGRQPISVDGVTALRILHGQLDPESVYTSRLSPNALTANKKEEPSNGGWVMAEPILSTATAEDRSRGSGSGSNTAGAAAMAARTLANVNAAGVYPTGAGSGGVSGFNNAGGTNMGGAAHGGSVAGSVTAAGNTYNGSFASESGKPYTGLQSAPVDFNPNQTYSEMIEAANAGASKTLCARMGRFGDCK
jgi:hypothetical protein